MSGRIHATVFILFLPLTAREQSDPLAAKADLEKSGESRKSEVRLIEASDAFESSAAIRGSELGVGDGLTIQALNNLGVVYRLQGRPKEAEKLFRRALEAFDENNSSPLLPVIWNNLAQSLADQKQWKKARDLFQQAIVFWECNSGPDDVKVSSGLTNLALLLQSRRHYDEAAKLLARAQAIDQRAVPLENARIARDLNNAASLAAARKRFGEADDLLCRSLGLLRKHPGEERAEIGQVMANLAEVWFAQRRLDDSERLYRQALDVLEPAWGRENPRLLPWLDHYSQLLRAREDYAQAEAVAVEATRIRVRTSLREHR